MSRHRARAVLAATIALSLVAACSGDDDDDDDSAGSTPVTSATAPATGDGAVAPADTDAGEEPPPEPPSGEPVLTYGFIGPGVGLLNELAIGQERGLALAIQDINAAGGVLGAPVASVRVDETASSSIDGVVDQLVGSGANLLVGPVGSATTAALVPALAERSLLACSASATASSLTADNSVATFARTALRDDYFAGFVADQLMAPADGSAPPATVTVMGRDDVYGNELTGALTAELTARGAAVDTVTYPSRRVTFPDEAPQVASANPERVVLVSYTEAPNLVAQLVAAGVPVERIVGLDGMLVPRLAEQTFPDDGNRANGLTVIATTGDRALMARLAEVPAAQAQTSYGGQMYDCAITLALAAIAAGSTEPTAIGQQLQEVTAGGRACSTFAHCVQLLAAGENIDYDGTTGHIAFDAAGDISSARVTTSVVIDGVLQPTAAQDIDLTAQRQQAVFASSVFVTQLQQALKVLGYFEGDVTGVYDEATTAAVAALQRDLGLPDTGQFDEATDAALRDQLGVRLSTFGTSVEQLQQALADRGYYSGPIDGRYSAATIEAVRAFQRDLGVPETGVIDVATLQAIYARGEQTGAATQPTVPPVTYPPPTTAPPTTAPEPPPATSPPETPPPETPPPVTAAPTPTTPPGPGPQDLFTVLTTDGRFDELVEIIVFAGYRGDLAQPGQLTIFAPVDDAIDDALVAELTADPEDLEAADAFLRNLAVEGSLTSAELTGDLRTLGGEGTLAVVDDGGGTITVGGATIVGADLIASNGVVHAMNGIPQG